MKLSILFAGLASAQVADDTWQSGGNVVAGDQPAPATVITVTSDQAAVAKDPNRKDIRSGAGGVTESERAERRYVDLKDMAIKLWAKNGFRGKTGFDERKYWAYGCHCFLLGDRPMSEMGSGKPKDALDNKCKAYKDCNKCVREKHGDDCIGEFQKYTWKWSSKQNTLISNNAPGTCVRELFECDKQMVYDTFAQKEVFNNAFHAFWSSQDGSEAFDNRDPANCPSGGNTPVQHMCCGGDTQPWYWIGLNKNQCCASSNGNTGNVASPTDSCEHGNFVAP